MLLIHLMLFALSHLRVMLTLLLGLILLSYGLQLQMAKLQQLAALELWQSQYLLNDSDYALSHRIIELMLSSPFSQWVAREIPSCYPYLCLIILRLALPIGSLLLYLPGWLCFSLILCSYLHKRAQFSHHSLFRQKLSMKLLTLLTKLLLPVYVLQPFLLYPTFCIGTILIFTYILLLPAYLIEREGLSAL